MTTTGLHGVYRAKVVQNDDPEGRLRVRVLVPSVTGMSVSGWCWPCTPPGHVRPPSVGAGVWVTYENGSIDHPVWIGGFNDTQDAAGSGLRQRQIAHYTTHITLIPGGIERGTIRLASDYRILFIQTSVPARVRLYVTSADQITDLNRQTTVEPVPGLGIVMDYLTADVLLSAPLSPVPEGATFNVPLTKDIPISVTSVDGGPVTVTLIWVSEE